MITTAGKSGSLRAQKSAAPLKHCWPQLDPRKPRPLRARKRVAPLKRLSRTHQRPRTAALRTRKSAAPLKQQALQNLGLRLRDPPHPLERVRPHWSYRQIRVVCARQGYIQAGKCVTPCRVSATNEICSNTNTPGFFRVRNGKDK